ncbi:MAG: ribonuclease III [Desulfuromonadaceae bacterium]|nr:ribonuclease III [Desulfuromonadaceae bacterium]
MEKQQLVDALQVKLRYQFVDQDLLYQALVHKSYANESLGDLSACNERLEFLGDAVLDLIVARHLFREFPGRSEGELSRIRSELVSAPALAAVARRLDLGRYLLLGRGERMTGGGDKDNLLADALEALFGALFLDGGWAVALSVVEPLFSRAAEQVGTRRSQDYKTRLQELAQAIYAEPPHYQLMDESGPDHQREYQVSVYCVGRELGHGCGRSKKAAQQQAAANAIQFLERELSAKQSA